MQQLPFLNGIKAGVFVVNTLFVARLSDLLTMIIQGAEYLVKGLMNDTLTQENSLFGGST